MKAQKNQNKGFTRLKIATLAIALAATMFGSMDFINRLAAFATIITVTTGLTVDTSSDKQRDRQIEELEEDLEQLKKKINQA